jgi:hypothetical protein
MLINATHRMVDASFTSWLTGTEVNTEDAVQVKSRSRFLSPSVALLYGVKFS